MVVERHSVIEMSALLRSTWGATAFLALLQPGRGVRVLPNALYHLVINEQ